MIPFLVLVGLVVIGVVGAVVAGLVPSGLAPIEHDRPDPGLPEGRLAADDVAAVRFTTAVRGYRMDEVDAVLARLREELAARDGGSAELAGPGAPAAAGADPSDTGR